MKISEENKIREGRGTGFGADYKPWIKTRELNSLGTACDYPDWKHGRMISLLSQAEFWTYLKLRWDDRNEDIREQFPLDKDRTTEIAHDLGYRMHDGGRTCMTTDFLVNRTDGSAFAVSVKMTAKDFNKTRAMQLYEIEKKYWAGFDIPLFIATKDSIDRIEVHNIEDVVTCYDLKKVHGEFDFARYLIARKIIVVDMKEPIDYPKLIKRLKKEGVWYRMMSELA